ncbi:hypothetical protein [Croceivirga sp. JEA036]|uniref:hypothetical protein n=1 Tax=Croceivirga sp. JEA036 TaxID=2721162 RepID=UPI00143A024C|nr:hypothetical protein [Croceivirga sp. JEA036]NJB36365.1 hypothetical protein [Croceivirga sp. JEA036]
MQATKSQKKYIHINTPTRDIKEEFVQWATGSVDKISCNDLSFEQANLIIEQLGGTPHRGPYDNWAAFNVKDSKHRYILSLCQQYGWVSTKNGRTVANLQLLAHWLYTKSPVKKPLKQLCATTEMPKVIKALEQMVNKKYK